MTCEQESLTRKHIIGVLSYYTGKILTSDILPKVTDDILQSVIEANKANSILEEDIPQ
jgi:hypothetical protein